MQRSNEEIARLGGWLEPLGDDIRELAIEGYDQTGPGAVFVSEEWFLGTSSGALCYLPQSHPLFADTSQEIRDVVDSYDPEAECVMVVASASHNVYLFLLYLRGADVYYRRKSFH